MSMTCSSAGGGGGSDAGSATVDAIVAVCNGGPVLGDCLDAIAAQSRAVSTMIVIDDASTDGSAALVRQRRDPRVKLIELPQNVGPAEARNRALPSVTADYVWIVDADCIPRPDCLANLCSALERDPRIGIVGGANPYNRQHATYAAAAFDWSNRYLVDPTAPASDAPYVVGANMLLRRAVFDGVGVYDPRLRIAEDFDLCVRARAKGWRVWFEPRAISEHRHRRTTIASYLR
jgi:GT2 family glycosyltransferase